MKFHILTFTFAAILLLTANAAADARYLVEHYQQNVSDFDYPLVPADVLDTTGPAGAMPVTAQKTYAGFAYQKATYEATGVAASGTPLAIASDGSLVVKLYYVRDRHTVIYNANGHGTAPAGVQAVRYGAALSEPSSPTAAGYTFNGWYTDAACSAKSQWDFAENVMPDADVTLYAKWTPNEYTVSFANDGAYAAYASLAGNASQSVAYLGKATGACTLTPAGTDYRLAGWSYDYQAADGSAQKGVVYGATGYTSVAVMGDVTFHAVIFKTSFISAIAANGYVTIAKAPDSPADPAAAAATEAKIENISYGALPATAVVKFAPISENYSFTKAVVRNFSGSPSELALKDGGNTFRTLDRDGGTVDVTVTLDLAKGTIVTNNTVGSSLEFDVVYSLVSATYQVNHYRQNADGNGYDQISGSAQTLTAGAGEAEYFTPGTYTGFAYQAGKTTYTDSSHNLPQTDALAVRFDGSSVVNLYYDRMGYQLAFDANGHGSAPDARTIAYGAAATAPAALSAADYTFGGWYTDAGCTGTAVGFQTWTMPANDVTLYAKWTENDPATITYASADTSMGTVSVASESVAPATGMAQGSVAAAKAGYRFVSWTDASGVVVSTGLTLVPAKSIDNIYVTTAYTANFAPNTYTVVFDANGAAAGTMDNELFDYGSAKALTANAFSRPGYGFSGWNTAVDGSGAAYADRTEVLNLTPENDGAVTLYAQWSEDDPVTVTYVSADTSMGTVSVASESVAPVTGTAQGSAATAEKGYKFVSWTDASGVVVSTDPVFVPAMVDGFNVAGAYTANFAVDKASAIAASAVTAKLRGITAAKGAIVIDGYGDSRVSVRGVSGRTLYRGAGNRTVNVPAGAYFVSVGGAAVRVNVK